MALLVVAGCGGPRAAGPSADRDDPPTARSSARATVNETELPPAGRAAVRYAVVTRSWTAANYADHHHRQLRLSTGSLRRALAQESPTREQIAAIRTDHARLDPSVLAATNLLQAPTQARYRLVLDERGEAAGQTVRQRAVYVVDLRRSPGGRWLVAAFTAVP